MSNYYPTSSNKVFIETTDIIVTNSETVTNLIATNAIITNSSTIPNVVTDLTDSPALSTGFIMQSNGNKDIKASNLLASHVLSSVIPLAQDYLVASDPSGINLYSTGLYSNTVLYRNGTLSNGAFLIAGAGSLLTSDVRVNLQPTSDLTLSGNCGLLGNNTLYLKSGSGNIVLSSTTGTGQISTIMPYNSSSTVSGTNLVSTQNPSMLKTLYAYIDARTNAIIQQSGGLNSVTQAIAGQYTLNYTALGLVNPPMFVNITQQDNTTACGSNILNNPTNSSFIISCFSIGAGAVQYQPVRIYIQIVGN